jgi:PAS domain S-box-containing protein
MAQAERPDLFVDHDRCAQEQVQIIGHIQPYGILFALSEPDLVVRQVSGNSNTLLGMPPEIILDRSLGAVLGPQQLEEFQEQVLGNAGPFSMLLRVPVSGKVLDMDCSAHRQDGVLIVELEPLQGAHSLDPLDFDAHVRTPLSRLRAATDISELSQVAASEIRRLSGFERVMIYRFDEEWNGEVIAEAVGRSPVSYFGMRFPAGDIPPQVRQLFLLNAIRAIADIDAVPAPIVPAAVPLTGRPLDLTYSLLRSASPIHLEYLRNMDVHASLTVSILVNGRLWGMIACHHPAPHRVAHSTRSVCELIGQTLAAQVALLTDNATLQSRLRSRSLLDKVVAGIEASESFVKAAQSEGARLLELFDADGLISSFDGVLSLHGVAAKPDSFALVKAKLRNLASQGVASSDELGALDPDFETHAKLVRGALYIGLAESDGDYLLFLRRELVETIAWAGNPNKSVLEDEHGRLHPRNSFEAWQETVHGFSRPWTEIELEIGLLLRGHLLRLQDERELARLNESLKTEITRRERIEADLEHAREKAVVAKEAAEAESKRSQFQHSLIRAIQEVSLDGILVVTNDNCIASHNKRFKEVWQFSQLDIQDNMPDYFVGDHPPVVMSAVLERVKDPDAFMTRIRELNDDPDANDNCEIELKDGRTIERYSASLRSETGPHLGRVWFFRDITERRRAEQALRNSEERFRTLFEQAADGIVITDIEGNFQFANPAFLAMTGYPGEEVIGQSTRLLNSRMMPADYYRALWNTILAGQVWQGELINRRKDGTLYTEEMRIAPLRDANGIITGYVAIKHDVTKRKQAEEALRSSEEKFRQLAENIQEVFWMMNAAGTEVLYVSPAYESIWGSRSENPITRPSDWMNTIHPDYRAMSRDIFMRQLKGESTDFEYRALAPEGKEKWIRNRAFPVRDEHGELIRIAGVAEDITERKRAEELLKQTADRLALAASAGSAGIWDLDCVNNVLHWDKQMARLYAFPENQLCGNYETWLIQLHPEDRSRAEEEFDAAMRGEKELDSQFRILWHDGSIHHIRANALVRRDAAGKPIQIVGTNRDITAQKEAAAALLDSNLRLQEETERARESSIAADKANAAKSEFLANMSHEIRTPMNGVIGMTGLLLDTELTAEQRRFAEIARASGESLLQLINDILDFSKMEAKKLELETIDFNLPSLLDNLVSVLSAPAQAKGIELRCIADPAVPTQLRGDPGRLRQILTNLTGNAIKFTEKGEVVVRAALEEEGESDCLLRFSVRDTGIGIPEDKIGVLFNKFSQVDASTTRKYGGTGLGLAISKQLVEMMGGKVGVTSQEGKGSEFWFTVRLGRSLGLDGEAERAESKFQTIDNLTGRILIAEDNSTNREVALGMLRKLGLRADAVADGAEAINALKSISYDLVLMDMRMPVMDGIEATRQIRNPQSAVLNHEIPIIALTANAMQSDRESCLAAGMNDFVPKPIIKAVLQNALTKWLRADEVAIPAATGNVVPSKSVDDMAAIFDRKGVLGRLEGDNELAQIIFAEFVEDIPRQIQTLKELLKSGDTTGSARQAHSIRGASASVGGEGLRRVATEMEKAADAGDLDSVNIRMNELEAQFLLLRDAIRNERDAGA